MLRPLFVSGTAVLIVLGLGACGFGGDDDKDKSDSQEAPVPPGFSQTPITPAGTLALALPIDMNLTSGMTSSQAATLNLQSDGVTETTRAQTAVEKKAQIDSILNAESLQSCFALTTVALSQPGCFAPNIQPSDITDAASGANPYVIAMPDGVTQQLYGDGGIARKSENSESCTAATINYFTEEALNYIEQGRQAFATLACISKFNDTISLPEPGDNTDYMPIIGAVVGPGGLTFSQAEIAAETHSDGSTIYTTQITVQLQNASAPADPASTLYAYFRHAPALADGSQLGHVVVMRNGQSDALQSANQLLLQSDPPGPGGGPPNPDNQAGGTGTSNTNVAAVSYSIADGTTKANLTRATFKGDNATAENHPATYFDDNGLLNYVAIGGKDSGNNFADNLVDTRFVQNPDSETAGAGVVGWTASLNDGFWRSFAYRVGNNADGSQTAYSTFGFSQGYSSTDTNSVLPTAANGMFCYWAQMNSNADNGATHLEASGLSGPASNKVQYQVSTRATSTGPFLHSDGESQMSYTIATDCGTNDLADVASDGSITGVFTAPTTPSFTPLGGVNLDFNVINISDAP